MVVVRYICIRFGMILLLLIFTTFGHLCAENIDPDDLGFKYAYAENVGWINFKPSFGSGVTVTDSTVAGYAWGENIGWINLSPVSNGIVNDGLGNLSGYAWGENIGWISFSCENTASCQTVSYGVTIDPDTGQFSGKAWGENIGWITFDHARSATYGVKTAWPNDDNGDDDDNGGGGGGSSGICFIITLKDRF